MEGAGETATLRRFASISGGAPQFGVQDTNNYAPQLVTGLFTWVQPGETMQPGGLTQAAQLHVSLSVLMDARDEIFWRGTAYRADGQSTPVHLGGRVQYQTPLKLANAV